MDEKPSSTQGPAAKEEDVEILHLDLPPRGLRDEIWAGSVRLSSVRPTEEDKAGKQVTLCLPAVLLYIPEPQDLGTDLGAVIRAAGEAAASRASSPAPGATSTPSTRDTPLPPRGRLQKGTRKTSCTLSGRLMPQYALTTFRSVADALRRP